MEGKAEVPLLVPPLPFPPPTLTEQEGEKENKLCIEEEELRNPVTLTFMLIQFSTGNIYIGIYQPPAGP